VAAEQVWYQLAVMLVNQDSLDERHDRAISFVQDAQQELGTKETFRRLISFMLSYLSLMRNSLPEAAKMTLDLSEKLNSTASTSEKFDAARIRCWNYLESTDRTYDFDNREAIAIRAVLCTLETDPSKNGDLGEYTSWFLKFADAVEDHSSEIMGLLKRCFG
jgi:hypothetical protein